MPEMFVNERQVMSSAVTVAVSGDKVIVAVFAFALILTTVGVAPFGAVPSALVNTMQLAKGES